VIVDRYRFIQCYGRPEHILIALESENGHPMLQIADDGTGFELTGQYEGMGLKSMFYRASLIGATLTLSPVETGGTLVTCKFFRGGVTYDDERKNSRSDSDC
jgi:signal transduction histidine kinase